MLERLNSMSDRAKLLMAVALIVLTLLAAWCGYNFGYWMGHN